MVLMTTYDFTMGNVMWIILRGMVEYFIQFYKSQWTIFFDILTWIHMAPYGSISCQLLYQLDIKVALANHRKQ